jgi:hypothetical protein
VFSAQPSQTSRCWPRCSPLSPPPSHAAEPDKDHPLVGRYEGSTLFFHQPPKYNEFSLLKSPLDWRNREKTDALLPLEGNVSFYYYDLPKGRSSLEVLRNHESSLKAKGLEILFSCGSANGSCYTDQTEKTRSGPPTC